MHAEANQAAVDMGYRDKADVAKGIMMHVGGNYDLNGSNKVAASEGCFGVTNNNNSSSNQSNAVSNNVLGRIINQANKSQSHPGKIEVIIEKRTKSEIPNNIKIDLNGNRR